MLSKSDFKIASSCAKKLVYKKAGYPTANDGNEYMEMLAQGGHVIAKYAQLHYSDGIEIKENGISEAISRTEELLKNHEKITLFEACFSSRGKVVRTDILEKIGNRINIIEVKSKSYDSDTDEPNPKKKLEEYIQDVGYQTLVVMELFPNMTFHSYLLLPDKSKTTKIEGLAGWFSINAMVDEKFEMDEAPAQSNFKFQKPLVEFKFENDPNRNHRIKEITDNSLLTLVEVSEQVNLVIEEIGTSAREFIEILRKGIKPEQYKIDKNCKACEFNLGKEISNNGYRECWNGLSDIEPHIFDLYFGGAIGSSVKGWYFDELISKGKVSLYDIDPERLKSPKGELGSRAIRQLLQINNTKTKQEWISGELFDILDDLSYPLHFIDFETFLGALPHHQNMRPYELIAFQWSCHTIHGPKSPPVHSEWINTEYEFPNFKFAESLMKQIGNSGTPLIWTQFENSTLKNILSQMDSFNYQNPDLKNWLTEITTDKKQGREGRFVDLNELCLRYYFHPEMMGKTSIKKVLPAIWNNNPDLRAIVWFQNYVSESNLNPYDTLSESMMDLENEEVVQDGTGAMRAYQQLMFGPQSKDPNKREILKKLLLQYCKLDTMAMVIIWKYWITKLKAGMKIK
jgi:hypothetical protein